MHDDPGQHLLIHKAPPGLLDRALLREEKPAPPSWRVPAAVAAAFLLGVGIGEIDLTTPPSPEAVSAEEPVAVAALTPVRLVYHAEDAATVGVAGSWNNWQPEPMQVAQEDGLFYTVVALPAGQHEYMFVIDGEQWTSDPTAVLTRDDGFGQKNAVLQIGA